MKFIIVSRINRKFLQYL